MPRPKTQPGNPHNLTLRQHVISKRSIARFAGPEGHVEARRAEKLTKTIRVKPDNGLFCALRLWDERAERGWMKQIEDAFQRLVEQVLSGEIEHIDRDRAQAVTRMYSLWYWRLRQEPPEEPDIQFNGVTGEDLPPDQQERYEKMGVLFLRPGGKMPARHMTGFQLQMKVDQYAHQLREWQWGVIQTRFGEFLMPDVPSHGMIPIEPKVMLAANHSNGTIRKPNLIEINVAFLAHTRRYFFARNLQTALAGVTTKDTMKAVKARDARLAEEAAAG
jgi:hypothetical protein